MSINKQVGLKRDTIDKFYTHAEVVLECYKHIKNHLGIKKGDLIIEPSAGNGAFIEIIKSLTDNYRFYDIEPENDEIIKQDYLDSNLNLSGNSELNPSKSNYYSFSIDSRNNINNSFVTINGIWDKQDKQWKILSEDYNRSIAQGILIAKKQAPPNLIKLPIPAPDEIK